MAHSHRSSIRFLLNDQTIELSGFAPDLTLLDWLRLDRRLTATKEGCAEGDCGACTVLVGRIDNGLLGYESVNACIRFVGSLDATHVVTVEHLSHPDGGLSAVQQAMVDNHGSQCGFCTPGIVASLHALWLSEPAPGVADIERQLQGNLCRCTGYEPIVKAAIAAANTIPDADNDRLVAAHDKTVATLNALNDGARVSVESERGMTYLPADVDDLADLYQAHPNATIVAGSTDVGLWVTKHMLEISPALHIGHIEALRSMTIEDTVVTLGASVSYTAARAALVSVFPQMEELWDRIGGEQVRNLGTVGGNIANGSPIGDTPPPLIALDASVTLRRGTDRRTLPLEDFYIEYGKQDRMPGEFVESISVPALEDGSFFAVYKISKRRDEDISALCGAFNVTLDGESRVTSARIAFGGMAGTPKRASATEAAMIGQPWGWDTVQAARTAMSQDFQPLSDWRASADYRMLSAQNLVVRFFLETCGAPVRLARHPVAQEA